MLLIVSCQLRQRDADHITCIRCYGSKSAKLPGNGECLCLKLPNFRSQAARLLYCQFSI